MPYAVKELYYTLQGEGIQAGRPAVFLRFSGCNLWSGRDADRARAAGSCGKWCDTDFVGTDGPGGDRYPSAVELSRAAHERWQGSLHAAAAKPFVVCTGGEPMLQLDRALIEALHEHGFEVAIETNGTLPVPPEVDWICVSPKAGAPLMQRSGSELKLVFPQPELLPEVLEELAFEHFLLQPLDGPERSANARLAAKYCLEHPRWRLSLQLHKLLGLP
jgi:7-carboxy-7-deazaguanine synthase (Cx14CxxC type)